MTKESDKKEMHSMLHLFYGCEIQVTEEGRGQYIGKMIGLSVGTVLVSDPQGHESWEDINLCLPVLRPVTDFKEMDIVDWAKLVGKEGELDAEENEIVLLSIKKRGWGAFDASLTFQQSILATKYFLSKRFDLFGWIELGLAVDKTKL